MISDERLNELIADVRCGNLYPKTLIEALELSLAKWHPIRGVNRGYGSCGLCSWTPCDHCPIRIRKIIEAGGRIGCTSPEHPWKKWDNDRTNENAEAVYRMILAAYETEVKP